MTALLMEIIPSCLELCVSYDWRATASKLSPRRYAFSFKHLGWLLAIIVCILGMGHSQATPGLLNACVTGCDEFARNSVYAEVRLSFSLLTWSTWRVFSPAGNAYAYIYITCECLQCDSVLGGEDKNVILPIFGGEYVWGGWSSSAISSLVINAFVCSVILYSEVSSRGYLKMSSVWNFI